MADAMVGMQSADGPVAETLGEIRGRNASHDGQDRGVRRQERRDLCSGVAPDLRLDREKDCAGLGELIVRRIEPGAGALRGQGLRAGVRIAQDHVGRRHGSGAAPAGDQGPTQIASADEEDRQAGGDHGVALQAWPTVSNMQAAMASSGVLPPAIRKSKAG